MTTCLFEPMIHARRPRFGTNASNPGRHTSGRDGPPGCRCGTVCPLKHRCSHERGNCREANDQMRARLTISRFLPTIAVLGNLVAMTYRSELWNLAFST